MTTKKLSYESSGVSYDLMDPFKKLAQKASLETINQSSNENTREITEALGESAFVYGVWPTYQLVFVQEGLGTKNLVADTMYKNGGRSYYDAVAQDTVAAIVNDLITVGAQPLVVNAYFGLGSSEWLKDMKRAEDLINGWKNACITAGAMYGGGETPTLTGIINPETIDLAGAGVGKIVGRAPILGKDLNPGDAIVLIESNGIHANGLTLARKIAEELEQGYLTKLPNGDTYGNSLLRPSHIYSKAINTLLYNKIDIRYMVNITGHGWRKLMRAKKNLSYTIETLSPNRDELFEFIKGQSGLSDEEMYGTFNMGAGFAVMLPSSQAENAVKIINEGNFGFKSWIAGKVEQGEKQVTIKPLGITFKAESLNIR
jgi:phosphoribosylformylglycinamidine cyclo-ligase